MLKLEGNHTTVCAKQESGEHLDWENKEGYRWNIKERTGWLQKGARNNWPDIHTKEYYRAVCRMAGPAIHQLYRLWKGLRQYSQRDTLEDYGAIWSTIKVNKHNTKALREQRDMAGQQRIAVRVGEDRERSEAGMWHVLLPFSSGVGLGHEEQCRGKEHRTKMEVHEQTRRPRLCWRHRSALK